ncbi:MAG: caspase family protein, partial [Treponema sp.]|nr:caspase family protein [Treponema sp.]
MKKIFVLCFMALVTVQVFFAQSRGMTVTAPDGATLTSFSGSHALVIGESAYNKGWMPLSGVKEDVTAVKRLFEEQGFSVTLLEDKTSRELITGIEDFFDRYGYEKDVRLIIYYAGHGQTLKLDNTRDMGYIVPIDAPVPARDETGFKRLAIPMQQFDTWAKKYESRHIMYIFDSCFSGSIFDTSRAAPGIIDYKISQPVRQFIASGAADETVPDKSIFRRQLEAGLRDRDADLNNDGYVSGSELGDFLQTTVVNYSNSAQHPQYGKIRDPNLDKGDFVFSVGMTQRQEITLAAPVSQELEVGSVSVASGALKINTITAGRLSITINNTNRDIGDLPGYASLPIPTISAG